MKMLFRNQVSEQGDLGKKQSIRKEKEEIWEKEQEIQEKEKEIRRDQKDPHKKRTFFFFFLSVVLFPGSLLFSSN